MADKPWSSLTDRERDAALHHAAFGGHIEFGPIPCPDGRAGCLVVHRGYTSEGVPVPCYITSLDAMRLVEDEIERRDKVYWYLLELYRTTCDAPDMEAIRFIHFHEAWFIQRATPAQRAEAAWRVLTSYE